MLLFGFFCAELSYVMKSKRIDYMSNVMSKHHGIFTKNFTIVFSNAGKAGNRPEFEFDKF